MQLSSSVALKLCLEYVTLLSLVRLERSEIDWVSVTGFLRPSLQNCDWASLLWNKYVRGFFSEVISMIGFLSQAVGL